MIYRFKCKGCGAEFEKNTSLKTEVKCPKCGGSVKKLFNATQNVYIPPYFHTSKSDVFTHEEWENLKKDPHIERAK